MLYGLLCMMCVYCIAEITVVLCEGSKLDILYGQAEHCPALHHVIKMSGTTSDEEKEKAEKSGLKLYNMIEVEVHNDFIVGTFPSIISYIYSTTF